ncbi:MAG: hypothetical protein ACRDPQ_14000 [Nocardioidaceae bacterium]
MSPPELIQIVDRAEKHLNHHGIEFWFNEGAKVRLADYANGFPWFVHVLGQTALIAVEDSDRKWLQVEGPIIVEGSDITSAVFSLNNNRFAQEFADTYQRVVGGSPNREMVLRAFALWPAEDVPNSDVYKILRNRLDMKSPYSYRTDLLNADILYSPDTRGPGLTRFNNEMFRVYVRICSSLAPGLDRRVEESMSPVETVSLSARQLSERGGSG